MDIKKPPQDCLSVAVFQSLLAETLQSIAKSNRPNQDKPNQDKTSLTLVIALSGGVDSIVLMDLIAASHQFLELNLKANIGIKAVYVNHHLQEQADDWQLFCQTSAEKQNIGFEAVSVLIKDKHKNIEAQAREKRYQALNSRLTSNSVLLTGHHQNDQVETFILNLCRGSGLDGLTAMPAVKALNEGFLVRALLAFSRDAIVNYAEQKQLSWINDPSNDNQDFDRNFIRSNIMPLLKQRWPSFEKQTAQSINHLQSSRALIGGFISAQFNSYTISSQFLLSRLKNHFPVLDVSKLAMLESNNISEIIRYWLTKNHPHKVNISFNKMAELLNFICKFNTSHNAINRVKIDLNGWVIVNNKHELYLVPEKVAAVDANDNSVDNTIIGKHADSDEIWHLKNGLIIRFEKKSLAKDNNFKLSSNYINKLHWLLREGGETIMVNNTHQRALKKLWQPLSIPFWEKTAVPLLYYQNTLVWALGLVINNDMANAINAEVGFSVYSMDEGLLPSVFIN